MIIWFFPADSGPFLLDASSSVTSDMVRMCSAQRAETDSRLTMGGIMINHVPTGRAGSRRWHTVFTILVARHYVTGENDKLSSEFLKVFNRCEGSETRRDSHRMYYKTRCIAVAQLLSQA